MLAGTLVVALFVAPPPAGAADAFTATAASDDRPTGRITRLTPDGTVELAIPGGTATVRDVISLRRTALPLPAFPRGPVLLTTTGDRIPGVLTGGTGETLRFRPAFAAADWDVPVSAAAVVWSVRAPTDTPADPARYAWLGGAKRDVVRFRNGDTLPGTFVGFTADAGVKIAPDGGGDARTVPATEVSALAFNPGLARARKPKGPYLRLVLRDGTRLHVTDATADDATLAAKTLFGRAVEIPLADLVGLDTVQGRAVSLADLKPKRAERASFFTPNWSWTPDRTVRGAPLRLTTAAGDATFDRGLGTHPRTTLTYDLGGKYRRFEALVGLDAATGGRGRAVVRVLIDGKEAPLPDLLTLAAGPAVPVRLSVVGAKELTLVVDFGPAGDVQADVNWADARLVE